MLLLLEYYYVHILIQLLMTIRWDYTLTPNKPDCDHKYNGMAARISAYRTPMLTRSQHVKHRQQLNPLLQ
jgi:hypothetical protein